MGVLKPIVLYECKVYLGRLAFPRPSVGKTFLQWSLRIQNHRVWPGESQSRRTRARSRVWGRSEQCSCYVGASKLPGSVDGERRVRKRDAECGHSRLTWVIKNLAILSLSLSLDKIISNMSPFNFSITTKIRSGLSNILSRFTTPVNAMSRFPVISISFLPTLLYLLLALLPLWEMFWRMETSFFNWSSCFRGNRSLSITLMATGRLVFLWTPATKEESTMLINPEQWLIRIPMRSLHH